MSFSFVIVVDVKRVVRFFVFFQQEGVLGGLLGFFFGFNMLTCYKESK